jgi:serine/threonine-protein kinase 24/25/MST4
MAKKTSYLTELIERHERWKAEGGERAEEETHDRPEDLSVIFCILLFRRSSSFRLAATDPEDLWDFGTVRTVARPGTIGRASGVQTSGPPLTWDYNGTTRSRGSSGSGASIASANGSRRDPSAETDTTVTPSITAKPDRLPPLAPSDRTPRKLDQQATVRHGAVGSNEGNGVRRELSDEYDDLEDRLPEDDLPDTTMLDSVVLPAIASVRKVKLWTRLI